MSIWNVFNNTAVPAIFIYLEILAVKVWPKSQKYFFGRNSSWLRSFWSQSIGTGQGYSGPVMGCYVRACEGRCLLCRYGTGTNGIYQLFHQLNQQNSQIDLINKFFLVFIKNIYVVYSNWKKSTNSTFRGAEKKKSKEVVFFLTIYIYFRPQFYNSYNCVSILNSLLSLGKTTFNQNWALKLVYFLEFWWHTF